MVRLEDNAILITHILKDKRGHIVYLVENGDLAGLATLHQRHQVVKQMRYQKRAFYAAVKNFTTPPQLITTDTKGFLTTQADENNENHLANLPTFDFDGYIRVVKQLTAPGKDLQTIEPAKKPKAIAPVKKPKPKKLTFRKS